MLTRYVLHCHTRSDPEEPVKASGKARHTVSRGAEGLSRHSARPISTHNRAPHDRESECTNSLTYTRCTCSKDAVERSCTEDAPARDLGTVKFGFKHVKYPPRGSREACTTQGEEWVKGTALAPKPQVYLEANYPQ